MTPSKSVKIAVAGKYSELQDAYKSISEALRHAGMNNDAKVEIVFVNTEKDNVEEKLKTADGILIPGGFGGRGVDGKIATIKYAREHKIPFLGICLGMQCTVIEAARNLCGLHDANSTEFDPTTKDPVVDLTPQQKTWFIKAAPCVWATTRPIWKKAPWRASCTAKTKLWNATATATSSTPPM